jgi:hypothetical protein
MEVTKMNVSKNGWPSYSKTRYKYVGLSKCDANLWRFVCLDFAGGGTRENAPSVIGPHYKTKHEALADLSRYAVDSGYSELA